MSSMSPEKVKLQQQLVRGCETIKSFFVEKLSEIRKRIVSSSISLVKVREAVEKEVEEKKLDETEAKKLLVTTMKVRNIGLAVQSIVHLNAQIQLC